MHIKKGSTLHGAGQLAWVVLGLIAAAMAPKSVWAFQKGSGSAGSPKLGDSKVNPKDGLTYLWIPPGSYIDGCSPKDTDCFPDETPNRKTTLTRGFWLSRTEVTASCLRTCHGLQSQHLSGIGSARRVRLLGRG